MSFQFQAVICHNIKHQANLIQEFLVIKFDIPYFASVQASMSVTKV